MIPLNVLLVSYSFPPVGGTGVIRAANLARYLSGEGIHLDVLTARNASAVGNDAAFLKEIPDSVNVHRTFTFDLPFGIRKRIKKVITGDKPRGGQTGPSKPNIIKRTIQDILQPDPQVTWFPVAIRAASRIVEKSKIDLVIITVPPFSCLLLVSKLRKRFPNLAIVADFRDEWISTAFDLVSFLFSSTVRSRNLARRVEARAIANSTAVVAVTEAARREIRGRYPQEAENKFQLIPNGFDATRLQRHGMPPGLHPDRKIIVTYVGTIYASTEPTTVVQALKSLPPEVKLRFKLRFIGHIEERRYRDALLELGDLVELKGYMPQGEALAAMNETDYALLINHDPLNVGGKFYDYVGGGKPVLGAIHPKGETRRLLEELKAGWWADIGDVESIRQLFLDAATRGDSLSSEFHPDMEKIAQYERKVLAQRYAELLHSIVGGNRDRGSESSSAQFAETGV